MLLKVFAVFGRHICTLGSRQQLVVAACAN